MVERAVAAQNHHVHTRAGPAARPHVITALSPDLKTTVAASCPAVSDPTAVMNSTVPYPSNSRARKRRDPID